MKKFTESLIVLLSVGVVWTGFWLLFGEPFLSKTQLVMEILGIALVFLSYCLWAALPAMVFKRWLNKLIKANKWGISVLTVWSLTFAVAMAVTVIFYYSAGYWVIDFMMFIGSDPQKIADSDPRLWYSVLILIFNSLAAVIGYDM